MTIALAFAKELSETLVDGSAMGAFAGQGYLALFTGDYTTDPEDPPTESSLDRLTLSVSDFEASSAITNDLVWTSDTNLTFAALGVASETITGWAKCNHATVAGWNFWLPLVSSVTVNQNDVAVFSSGNFRIKMA